MALTLVHSNGAYVGVAWIDLYGISNVKVQFKLKVEM